MIVVEEGELPSERGEKVVESDDGEIKMESTTRTVQSIVAGMDKVPLEQLESLRALAHIVAGGKFEVLQGTTSKSLGVVEDVITFSPNMPWVRPLIVKKPSMSRPLLANYVLKENLQTLALALM